MNMHHKKYIAYLTKFRVVFITLKYDYLQNKQDIYIYFFKRVHLLITDFIVKRKKPCNTILTSESAFMKNFRSEINSIPFSWTTSKMMSQFFTFCNCNEVLSWFWVRTSKQLKCIVLENETIIDHGKKNDLFKTKNRSYLLSKVLFKRNNWLRITNHIYIWAHLGICEETVKPDIKNFPHPLPNEKLTIVSITFSF